MEEDNQETDEISSNQVQTNETYEQAKETHGLIKAISIIYFIYAIGLIFILVKLVSAVVIKGKFITGYIVLMVILLVLSILPIIIGIGLWKSKKWAKVIAIIFSIALALYSIFSNTLNNLEISIFGFGIAVPIKLGIGIIVINIAIGGYLLLSKK